MVTAEGQTEYGGELSDFLEEVETPVSTRNIEVEKNMPDASYLKEWSFRIDPNSSQEEKKLNGVLFKMFDGSMIKPGKFLPIGDANFVHGMDPATKDRLFGLTLELDRFQTPEEFGEYATRLTTKGGDRNVLKPDEWHEIGEFLKNSTLSNRSIGHVIDQIRGGFSVDYDILDLNSEEKAQHVKAHLTSFTKQGIIDTFQEYIETRQKIDEESVKKSAEEKREKMRADLEMQATLSQEVAAKMFPNAHAADTHE